MTQLQFHKDHTIPPKGWIWVFGSNLAGRHGAGAAKVAHKNFGAQYGCGEGPSGESYAIATKSRHLHTLSLEIIRDRVGVFIETARANPKKNYFVTRIGCELAGYTDADIAPMFKGAPANCSFAEQWKDYL